MPIFQMKAKVSVPAVVTSPRIVQNNILVEFANGQKHKVARLADCDGKGAYAIVAPPSGEVTIQSVTPPKTTLGGGRVVNGAMVDPVFASSTHGIDSAGALNDYSFDSSLSVDFPVTRQVGQTLVCSIHNPLDDPAVDGNTRFGLCNYYAAFHIVSSEPTETTFCPPVSTWPGRSSPPQMYDIDVAAFVDSIPASYSTAGQNPPSFEKVIDNIARFAPLAQMRGGSPGAYRWYQQFLPYNFSQGLKGDLQGNHGQYAARSISTACLAMISDAYTREEKIRIATCLISHGIQWGDPVFAMGYDIFTAGGHGSTPMGPIAMARAARGLDNSNFVARAGDNFKQCFQVTQAEIDMLAPHDGLVNYTSISHRRTITYVSGTTIRVSINIASYGTNTADASSMDFGHNLLLTRESDGATAYTSGFYINSGRTTDTELQGSIDQQPATPFAVGDVVYFQPPYTPQVGQYDWVSKNVMFSNNRVEWYPSAHDFYRNQQSWGEQALLLKVTGWVDVDPKMPIVFGYANTSMMTDTPSPLADYASVNGTSWGQQFYDQHGAGIFA